MSSRHLVSCVVILAYAAGCGVHHTASHQTKTVDTAFVGRRVSDETVAALRAAGTSIDTIIVSPDHLDLRVGESVIFFRALTLRAIDTTGAEVVPFAPTFMISDSKVFTTEGPMLRGLSPGEESIYVEALPRTTGVRTRPSTEVRIIVHP